MDENHVLHIQTCSMRGDAQMMEADEMTRLIRLSWEGRKEAARGAETWQDWHRLEMVKISPGHRVSTHVDLHCSHRRPSANN